jgi:predicted ABC-type transport system involved in lysophospholipase L1 biosynthesis ATPase subunit
MDLLFEIAGEAGSTLLTVTHDPIFIERLDVVHQMVLGKITDGSGDGSAEALSEEAS